MPNLASFLAAGRAVRITGPEPFLPGGVWPTLVTAHPSSAHQVVFHWQLRPGTQRIQNIPPEMLRRPPFWKYLSDAGRRSTVVSVYGAPALDDFLGTQVIGWGSYDPYTTKVRGPDIRPPEVLEILERAAPGRRHGFLYKRPTKPEEFDHYRDEAMHNISQQAAGLQALMKETDWDFFFGNFFELHEAGHRLWHLHDPDSFLDPEYRRFGVTDHYSDIYRAVDGALGAVLQGRQDGATVFLVTPHGMGPNVRNFWATEGLLEAAGWLLRGARGSGRLGLFRSARGLARGLLPLSARRVLGKVVKGTREELIAHAMLSGVDWEGTRAFPLPNDNTSFIRFNLKGREPDGVVDPDEYRDLCERVVEVAKGLVDADNGSPAVREIVILEDAIGYRPKDVLPDVVIVWVERPIRAVRSEEVGEVEIPQHDHRTGDHAWGGWLIGVGPGIEASGSAVLDGPTHRLIDFGPTVLRKLGLEMPRELPGSPIPEFFD
jgi:predicted AlkP superfamily phosphohydrolase/phosphomutase